MSKFEQASFERKNFCYSVVFHINFIFNKSLYLDLIFIVLPKNTENPSISKDKVPQKEDSNWEISGMNTKTRIFQLFNENRGKFLIARNY